MMSSGINLVMTVIGFAVSTMFIVFVCTRLICARIHLNSSRRSFHIASRSDLSTLERGSHGLEPVVVANFPTKKYSDEFFSAAKDAQPDANSPLLCGVCNRRVDHFFPWKRCIVCLADYHQEDILRILPSCGHSFHVTCIDIWLHQQSTCPVCRISLREVPERKRFMQPLFSSAIRSHYSVESFDAQSYHHMLTRHGFSSRTHVNRGMDPIQEVHFTTDTDGADTRENISPSTETDQISKDSGTKRVESPSNPET